MPRRRRQVVINLGCTDSEDESPPSSAVSPSPRTRSRSKRKKNTKSTARSKKKNESTNDVITVVDDSEKSTKKTKTIILEDGLEVTIDDDSDEEMEQSLRVIWSQTAEVHRFTLKPSEKVQSIFDFFSKQYSLPMEQLKIRKGDQVVSMYDTVESLNLRVTQVLEAYAVQDNSDSCKDNGEGKVEVKCLLQALKKPLVLFLHKHQDISCLLPVCANEIDCDVDNLILKFDGEKVMLSETPETLGLEGGECFEIHTKS